MKHDVYFRVDASLMQQLGASLITDNLQALIELIKNSYDADATRVTIIIDAPDRIVIQDNGHGMDEASIERGWLTLSNSLKLEQKRQGILTQKQKRTPLGDNGLGRLSTQRLGNQLKIETVPDESEYCYSVVIDWPSFRAGVELGKVPVEFDQFPRGDRESGTKLIISDLVDPEHWLNLKNEELRVGLASAVSPYSEVMNFNLQAFLNGIEVSPSELVRNIKTAAWQHFDIKFDGEQLVTTGNIKSQPLRRNKEDYDAYFQPDGGEDFLNYLLADKRAVSYKMARSKSTAHFVDFEVTRSFADIVGKRDLGNPGEFSGEVDSFSLETQGTSDVMQGLEALNSAGAARRLIKDLSGIRPYRDGFVIRTDDDWLRLGSGQTSGGSYYGLRPLNTMGYVALSALTNSVIRETTNRQGFVEDRYYLGLFELLQSFIRTTSDVLEVIRRSWLEYVRQKRSQALNLASRDPKVVEEQLNDSFERVADAKGMLTQAARVISDTIADQDQSLFPADTKLKGNISNVREILNQASETLNTVTAREGLTKVLVGEFEALQARLGEVYELVSLGITTEALSHDISVILERLSVETSTIQKHAKSSRLEDIKILRYFEVVRSIVSGLERQISHLDPALKYIREKRDTFALSSLIAESCDYYRDRLEKRSISFEAVVASDFQVSMNKGKLIQVMDNLVLNSEYWVEVSAKQLGTSPSVRVTIERPSIVVDDNGRGIEPAYEDTLFEPFVSAKPKGEGRGLGLFIATQLLELDGCTLRLLSERNMYGRRFRIAVGLEGVEVNA